MKTALQILEEREQKKCCLQCDNLPESVHKARLLTYGEVDRWEEFKRLEEQGKLLKLPCTVGDLLYVVRFGDIELHKVTAIEIQESGIYLKSERDKPFCELGSFGKTVFFTRVEAEATLERTKNETK